MSEINFNKNIIKALSSALIDDFRGFLTNNCERIEVPDGDLHAVVAINEMSKIPGWEYKSGTGQNPITDFMEQGAIYITKISIPGKKGDYQRTVGYLTNAYSEIVEYKGKKQPAYEVLKQIAIGMGYDVDEYTLQEKAENSANHPVSVINYKGKMHINKSPKIPVSHQKLPKEYQPVFIDGELIGFKIHGKYYNKNHFNGFSDNSQETNTSKNNNDLIK